MLTCLVHGLMPRGLQAAPAVNGSEEEITNRFNLSWLEGTTPKAGRVSSWSRDDRGPSALAELSPSSMSAAPRGARDACTHGPADLPVFLMDQLSPPF